MKKIKEEQDVRGNEYPSWSSGIRSDSLSGFSSMSVGSISEITRCGLKKFNRKTQLNAFLCGKQEVYENDSGLYDKQRDNNTQFLGNHTGGYIAFPGISSDNGIFRYTSDTPFVTLQHVVQNDRLNLEEKEILRAALKPQLEPIQDYDLANALKGAGSRGYVENNNGKDELNKSLSEIRRECLSDPNNPICAHLGDMDDNESKEKVHTLRKYDGKVEAMTTKKEADSKQAKAWNMNVVSNKFGENNSDLGDNNNQQQANMNAGITGGVHKYVRNHGYNTRKRDGENLANNTTEDHQFYNG